MIKKCKINHNSSAITLLEILVKFFTKQAMNIELIIYDQGKYDIVKHISVFLRKRIESALSNIICVHIKNFLHQLKVLLIASFAFASKLVVIYIILSVKAETYEVAAC
jgi:hypothetical protein